MVMGTGIMRGAVVAAITTVGTNTADIIMDGTGADIADGIRNIRQGRPKTGGLDYHRVLFNERGQSRQSSCATQFSRRSTGRCGQAAKCRVTAFGAFEDFLGDMTTHPVFFSPD